MAEPPGTTDQDDNGNKPKVKETGTHETERMTEAKSFTHEVAVDFDPNTDNHEFNAPEELEKVLIELNKADNNIRLIGKESGKEYASIPSLPKDEREFEQEFPTNHEKIKKNKSNTNNTVVRMLLTIKTTSSIYDLKRVEEEGLLNYLRDKKHVLKHWPYETTKVAALGFFTGITILAKEQEVKAILTKALNSQLETDEVLPKICLMKKTIIFRNPKEEKFKGETDAFKLTCDEKHKTRLLELISKTNITEHFSMGMFIPFEFEQTDPTAFYEVCKANITYRNNTKIITLMNARPEVMNGPLVQLHGRTFKEYLLNEQAENESNDMEVDERSSEDQKLIHYVATTNKTEDDGKYILVCFSQYFEQAKKFMSEEAIPKYQESSLHNKEQGKPHIGKPPRKTNEADKERVSVITRYTKSLQGNDTYSQKEEYKRDEKTQRREIKNRNRRMPPMISFKNNKKEVKQTYAMVLAGTPRAEQDATSEVSSRKSSYNSYITIQTLTSEIKQLKEQNKAEEQLRIIAQAQQRKAETMAKQLEARVIAAEKAVKTAAEEAVKMYAEEAKKEAQEAKKEAQEEKQTMYEDFAKMLAQALSGSQELKPPTQNTVIQQTTSEKHQEETEISTDTNQNANEQSESENPHPTDEWHNVETPTKNVHKTTPPAKANPKKSRADQTNTLNYNRYEALGDTTPPTKTQLHKVDEKDNMDTEENENGTTSSTGSPNEK
jgi:hypothetical protein